MSSLISFLGGSAFRMIWGELSAYLSKKQDHKHELERIQAQSLADDQAHARRMDALKTQSELGIKMVNAAAAAEISKTEVSAWADVVAASGRKTGIAWVDAWNSGIRPAGASLALLMIIAEIIAAGFVIPETTQEVFFAFLGIFIADRSLGRRGK